MSNDDPKPAENTSATTDASEPIPTAVTEATGIEPADDFLREEGQWGAWARIILAAVAIPMVVATGRDHPILWTVTLLYFGLAIVALFILRTGKHPALRVNISLVLDGAVVTAMVWAAGAAAYPMPIFYPVLVIAYAMRGGVRLGRYAAAYAITSYLALLVLEYFEVIPRAPLTLEGGPEYVASLEPHIAFAIVTTAIILAYIFIASTLGRIRYHMEAQRRLLASEREARAQSEMLQTKLDETERLESLGRLAGGVAHDFNNLLTSILGHARLVQEGTPSDSQDWRDLREVIRGAEQGAELTAQLLAYGRRQLVRPEVFDLNGLVQQACRMLERTVGEDVQLRVELADAPAVINADRSQLERVLLNLTVNARDAMPKGGELRVSTAVETNDPERPIALTVLDTGLGMTPEIMKKVFEPFFTTKGTGKGTGLGLAMVYGVVRQIGGTIDVRSSPGEGTSFVLRLPAATTPAHTPAVIETQPTGGHETVLVVEDDAMVRRLTERVLKRAGYRVLSAGCGDEAISVAAAHGSDIDLLLSDVVMPGLSGMEFVRAYGEKRPESAVLLMSGYTAERIGEDELRDNEMTLLAKPFTRDELLDYVRQVLDARRQGEAS